MAIFPKLYRFSTAFTELSNDVKAASDDAPTRLRGKFYKQHITARLSWKPERWSPVSAIRSFHGPFGNGEKEMRLVAGYTRTILLGQEDSIRNKGDIYVQ